MNIIIPHHKNHVLLNLASHPAFLRWLVLHPFLAKLEQQVAVSILGNVGHILGAVVLFEGARLHLHDQLCAKDSVLVIKVSKVNGAMVAGALPLGFVLEKVVPPSLFLEAWQDYFGSCVG